MIIHLSLFINNLRQCNYEIVVGIDPNEANDKAKNGVAKLLHHTKLIDIIIYVKILKTENARVKAR